MNKQFETHDGLKIKFFEACKKIGVPQEKVKYYTSPLGDGSAHVEIDKNGYHYVVSERGQEAERKTTTDADELVYWLLADVIFDMASKYELKHRAKGQDSRRILFAKEIELFEQVNPAWAIRKQEEIKATVAENPYVDK
jgi:hypothetical protein